MYILLCMHEMQCGVGTVTSHRVRLSTSTWRNIPNICCCLCVLSISTLYSRSALFHNHNGTADTITIYCDAFCKAPIIVKTKAANPWSISIWINEFESESDSVRRFIYWIIGVGSRLHINICWSSGEIFQDPWLGRIWWKFDFLKIHFSSDFSLEGHLLWSIIS